MNSWLSGIGVIFSLEMRQRVRGVAWYVLLGVFFLLTGIVSVLVSLALGPSGLDRSLGGILFSVIVFFVLLLGTLVAPALSGNSINGDRDAGTLATTQITLIGTWQLILGKFLASWVTALAFLAAAVPFLLYAGIVGKLSPLTVIVPLIILAVELGVVAAIGVGLSGILARPLFSLVLSYLAVAALSLGTVIAFTLVGLAIETPTTTVYSSGTSYDDNTGQATACAPPQTEHGSSPRFDLTWGLLAANPYVVLADATPTTYDKHGTPNDLFGFLKFAERSAQMTPEFHSTYDECSPTFDSDSGTPRYRHTIDTTVPGWFVGLLVQLALAAAALIWAWERTRTPAARLPKGSRIA